MMARIVTPIILLVVGLLLSAAVGIGVTWRTVNALVQRTVIMRSQETANEVRKKKGWDFWTVELENLSSELKEERELVKKEKEELDQRKATIDAAQRELAKARADVEMMQKQISERVFEIRDDEIVNLKKLAQTFSNLPAQSAVTIIGEMDDSTAVKILAQLKPDVIGPIFEAMSKGSDGKGPLARRAATLSDKLRLVKNNKPTTAP